MIDIAKVERLMALMSQYGVDVVDAEASGEKISLARNAGQHAFFSSSAPGGSQASAGTAANAGSAAFTAADVIARAGSGSNSAVAMPSAASAPAAQALPSGTTITSPFVGTFYRSASPDSPAFVEVGARVRKGQTLCIVEAMKLMNEIEAEIEGTVVAVLVENAKSVEYGMPLFIIAP
jgi:acetyl-CoA carboxylase biotin carboxyl carrier protein